MKYLFVAVTAASIGFAWCSLDVAGAAPITKLLWKAQEQKVVLPVDQKSQQGGIVNERSTGNEPFMGPGASGGPTHSAPGATENTIKQQPRDMEQGGNRSDKSSGRTTDGRPSESNPVTQQALEKNAEQGGGAAVAAEVLKEEGTSK